MDHPARGPGPGSPVALVEGLLEVSFPVRVNGGGDCDVAARGDDIGGVIVPVAPAAHVGVGADLPLGGGGGSLLFVEEPHVADSEASLYGLAVCPLYWSASGSWLADAEL